MKIEKKLIASIVGITIILAAFSIVAFATNQIPSTKTAVAGTEVVTISPHDTDGEMVAQAFIKSGNKELVLSFTSEAILYTKTGIKGSKASKASDAEASATIQVWAEIDGEPAGIFPSSVTFAERVQTMEGKLNETEFINLSLKTTNANGFNFIAYDIEPTPGHVHNVTIHARVMSDAQVGGDGEAFAEAWGALGTRTLVINEALLKEDSINFNP